MTNTTLNSDLELMNRRMENLMSMTVSMAQCGLTMGILAFEATSRTLRAGAEMMTGRVPAPVRELGRTAD